MIFDSLSTAEFRGYLALLEQCLETPGRFCIIPCFCLVEVLLVKGFVLFFRFVYDVCEEIWWSD